MATTIPTLRAANRAFAVGTLSLFVGFATAALVPCPPGVLIALTLVLAGVAIILAYRSASESVRLCLPEKSAVFWGAGSAFVTSALALTLAISAATYRIPRNTTSPPWTISFVNLDFIAQAIRDYHKQHGHLPPAAVHDKDGKPLLSWRVLLLPYLGKEVLFKRFHLDEPWDSTHNIQLLKEMPDVFARPFADPDRPYIGRVDPAEDEYSTIYQVFVGSGSVFEGQQVLTLDKIKAADGDLTTLLVIEAAEPVPWTKPQDLEYAPDKPLPAIGLGVGKRKQTGGYDSMRPNIRALFANGSVWTLWPESLDEKRLRAFITWNGGEKVKEPWE